MFRKESDLRDFIQKRLEEQGQEVSSEVTINPGYRVDLLVTWKNEDVYWTSGEKKQEKKKPLK
jgi:hypothetical protein